jgi:hypothetical protein
MSVPFKRHGDRIRWTLDRIETDLLISLLTSLLGVLDAGDVVDPVSQRLFPPTVLGDPEADAELRALIHDDLAVVKKRGLEEIAGLLARGQRVRDGLRVELDADAAHLVLGVLNDLRLSIGARVGIEQLDRKSIPPDAPEAYRLAVMDHLAYWQELLLAIVDPQSVRVHELRIDPDDPDDLGPDHTGRA